MSSISFYAASSCFISREHPSICAFISTSRPIFNSSIIPALLSNADFFADLDHFQLHRWTQTIKLFALSDTLQFSARLPAIRNSITSTPINAPKIFHNLINNKRYFCRTLKVLELGPSAEAFRVIAAAPMVALEELKLEYELKESDGSPTKDVLKHISQLTSLRVLTIQDNLDETLCDDDLSHLSSLINLTKLDFRSTLPLRGRGFAALSGLPRLAVLDLRGSYVNPEGIRDGVAKLAKLTELHLPNGRCTNDVLRSLATTCVQLRKLFINNRSDYWSQHATGGGGALDDDGIIAIATSCINLEELEMQLYHAITDKSLEAIGRLSYLRVLLLDDSPNITDAGVAHLCATNTTLQKIQLSNCPKLSDEAMKYLSASLSSLQFLDLENVEKVTDGGLAQIAKLTSLQYLNVNGCYKITNIGALNSLILLEELEVNRCPLVSDAGVIEFGNEGGPMMRRLKRFSCCIDNRQGLISDEGLCALARISSLERLSIRGCVGVTDVGARCLFTNLKYLKDVFLDDCSIKSRRTLMSFKNMYPNNTVQLDLTYEMDEEEGTVFESPFS